MGHETAAESFGRLWGKAPVMRRLFERLREIALTDSSVLIQGETGTGKELIAEALHLHSRRANAQYVVIDCASVLSELIESELFGHAKGAFTGAFADRVGAFEAGDGGTVFIDEIGELSMSLQPRLLRVLERQEVKRVGENTVRKIHVRVMAATNRDLEREVKEGRFREDLYFRLNVMKVMVPPLRDRDDDVIRLAERFLEATNKGTETLRLTESTKKNFLEYRWPGNVRELRNIVDRGHAMSDGRDFRLPDDFGRSVELDGSDGQAPGSGVGLLDGAMFEQPAKKVPGEFTRPLWEGLGFKDAKDAVLADFELGYVSALLETHGGNVSKAARAAGIHRNILHRLMAKYGLGR